MYGVGGRPIDKILAFDLGIIESLTPEIVLEISTNDHAYSTPEVRGSVLDDLVQWLLSSSPGAVNVAGWCFAIPRALSHSDSAFFRHRAEILNNDASTALDFTRNVFLEPQSFFFFLSPR